MAQIVNGFFQIVLGLFLLIFLIAGAWTVFRKLPPYLGRGVDRLMRRLFRRRPQAARYISVPSFVFFPEPRIRLMDEYGARVLWIGMGMRFFPQEAYLVVLRENDPEPRLMDISGKYYTVLAQDIFPFIEYARSVYVQGAQGAGEPAGRRR